ncbi:hypothetical protein FQZ97_1180270 [compost metagenome]
MPAFSAPMAVRLVPRRAAWSVETAACAAFRAASDRHEASRVRTKFMMVVFLCRL